MSGSKRTKGSPPSKKDDYDRTEDPPVPDPTCMTLCMMEGDGGGGPGMLKSPPKLRLHGGGAVRLLLPGGRSDAKVLIYDDQSVPHALLSLTILHTTPKPKIADPRILHEKLRRHSGKDPVIEGFDFPPSGVLPLISKTASGTFKVVGWVHISHSGKHDRSHRYTLEYAKLYVGNYNCSTIKDLSDDRATYGECVIRCTPKIAGKKPKPRGGSGKPKAAPKKAVSRKAKPSAK